MKKEEEEGGEAGGGIGRRGCQTESNVRGGRGVGGIAWQSPSS